VALGQERPRQIRQIPPRLKVQFGRREGLGDDRDPKGPKNQPAPLHRPASEASAVGIRLNRLNNLGTVSRVNVRGADSVITAPRPVRSGSCATGRRSGRGRRQSIEELLRIPGVSPGLIIIFSDEGSSQPVRPRGPPEEPFLLRPLLGPHPPRALRRVDMTAVFQHIPSSTGRVRKQDGGEQVFEDSDVRDIRGYELDFLSNLAPASSGGEILQAARYGVWSFHHSGEGPFRGVATCFWPIYNGDPITGTMLQRITDRLAGGIVLRSGTFRTALTLCGRPSTTCISEPRGGPRAYAKTSAFATRRTRGPAFRNSGVRVTTSLKRSDDAIDRPANSTCHPEGATGTPRR